MNSGVMSRLAPSVRSHRLARAPVGRQRAPPFFDVRLVLVPEMLQRSQDRRDGGIAERAQRLAGDIPGNAVEQIEVAHLAFRALCPAPYPGSSVAPFGASPVRPHS